MNISRMAHALVWVVLAATAAMLTRSNTPTATPDLLVVYLGRSSVSEDPRYATFAEALKGLPQDLRDRVRLKHVAALPEKERLEAAVSEALQMRPAAIIAPSTATAKSVRDRGAGIPVIFSSFTDPVRSQVVSSTGRRVEPLAGVWMADDLDAKRLELLRDAYPQIKTVAVLMDRPWELNSNASTRLPEVARHLGLKVTILLADDPAEARRVLDSARTTDFDAWYLAPSGMANLSTDLVLSQIRAWGKPVIVGRTQNVIDGAPISYMFDNSFRWPAMVELLSRVLRGEPPGSIPVQRPARVVLAVRPNPTQGFPRPSDEVVRRADLVIR